MLLSPKNPKQEKAESNPIIFYSSQIHGDLLPGIQGNISPSQISAYSQIKSYIINLLLREGYKVHEIIRPELYKHQISFKFLPNFSPGDIHLIFKPMPFIRPLKNALNIWVKAESLISNLPNLFHPFFNPSRMLSLVEEIWDSLPENIDDFHMFDHSRVFPISSPRNITQISHQIILERINKLLREK